MRWSIPGHAIGSAVALLLAAGASAQPLDLAHTVVVSGGPDSNLNHVAIASEAWKPVDTRLQEPPGLPGDSRRSAGAEFETGSYSFKIISPPGALWTSTQGINDAGQVTVVAEDESLGLVGYVYNLVDESYTYIGSDFLPTEINNLGEMVGSADGQCAIRDVSGNLTILSPPWPTTLCSLRGIDDGGQVCGNTRDDQQGIWRGFVYDSSATFDDFLPSQETYAAAVTNSGDVVGSVHLDAHVAYPGSAAGRYAYRRSYDGAVKLFEVSQSIPGFTRARGMSESGLVSGHYSELETGIAKGFVTSLSAAAGTDFEEITLTDDEIVYQKPCNPDLPAPPTPDYTLFTEVYLSQVRDDGVVVGFCFDRYYDGPKVVTHSYGFVATPVKLDEDGDGVPDVEDNCVAVANPSQIDADSDGFGNRCDADFDQNCVVNAIDLGFFRAQFFSSSTVADLNADGIVNVPDLGIFKTLVFAPPGPSSLAQCDP